MPAQKKVLIADDDEAIQVCMEDISQQEGWALLSARNGEECLELIRKEKPALLVLDQRMPKLTGEEVLAQMHTLTYRPDVILISAEKDLSRFRRFPFIVRVLTKPFDLEVFVGEVNQRLQAASLQRL